MRTVFALQSSRVPVVCLLVCRSVRLYSLLVQTDGRTDGTSFMNAVYVHTYYYSIDI